jgi:hypothetical protein
MLGKPVAFVTESLTKAQRKFLLNRSWNAAETAGTTGKLAWDGDRRKMGPSLSVWLSSAGLFF